MTECLPSDESVISLDDISLEENSELVYCDGRYTPFSIFDIQLSESNVESETEIQGRSEIHLKHSKQKEGENYNLSMSFATHSFYCFLCQFLFTLFLCISYLLSL